MRPPHIRRKMSADGNSKKTRQVRGHRDPRIDQREDRKHLHGFHDGLQGIPGKTGWCDCDNGELGGGFGLLVTRGARGKLHCPCLEEGIGDLLRVKQSDDFHDALLDWDRNLHSGWGLQHNERTVRGR
ncbi:hypothetical protein CA54_48560 [Symmachiella macrocystis]|uniref:Uncharacterized protein n=1 Tax=Symmachiella macrocystis TaxID=2527985 RepID=A0A5C6BGP8_9PLAN|nr:hypothetical protein CA54_48560 [Symmachiella macrocystis]